jgi:acetyl esterase/lipase
MHEGLVFAEPGEKLTMDLHVPRPAGKAVPCVLVIQGGGFSPQDGKRFRSVAVYLAEHGFAAATIAYRGRPAHTYKDTMADVRAAVRYVRSVSGKYGIDPDRIGAMGRSAGGTLAVLLAVTDETEIDSGDETAQSSRIQAAVGFAGVYDFVARFTDPEQIALQLRHEAKSDTNGEWIGEPFSAGSVAWRDASAINHVDAADPPVLFIHCKDDSTVPWPQSQQMYEKMREAGVDAEIEIFETGGHGCQPKDGGDPMARMVEFFRKILAKS